MGDGNSTVQPGFLQMQDIKGLEELKELRELYLHSNRISRIEGLEHNHNLRILWLCNNMIVDVENLGHLENLRELNLAQNSIERVGESLQNNVGLEHLNLAANSLGPFTLWFALWFFSFNKFRGEMMLEGKWEVTAMR